MDFIPEVATLANQPVEVPYLGLIQYDDKGFLTFPSRKGFNPYRLHVGDFHQHSAEQTEAFLQAWLYFGLICNVLQVPWKEQAFTSITMQGRKWSHVHGVVARSPGVVAGLAPGTAT
jgi:hypothetical protein